jgi:hypothetical protein
MAAVNWIFWGPVFIRGDYSYYHNTGLGEGIKDEYSLVNLGIGSKLFENNKGEIRLEVFDVLDQNTSLNRTVNETYIENKSTRVLQRFYLLTFTYNLSLFGQ